MKLEELHLDEFPFSASEVAKQVNKQNSISLITRERGGLKQFLYDTQNEFTHELLILVNEEKTRRGKISKRFCRKLGLLISDHYMLFWSDIIKHSHRNIELIIDEVRPLIKDRQLAFFAIELYLILREWQPEGFARELVLDKYSKRFDVIFSKYQITRPK